MVTDDKKGILDTRNTPKKNNHKKRCVWNVGKRFYENIGMANLGVLGCYLKDSEINHFFIDFGKTEWADPLPLLYLCLLLNKHKSSNIVISLGNLDSSNNKEHSVFLKFLSHQGFLRELGKCAKITLNGRHRAVSSQLSTELESTPVQTHYKNTDCIFASVIPLNDFASTNDVSHSNLTIKVEKYIHEARARAIDGFFGGVPHERDLIFQKLRKILFELILNAADHAYKNAVERYAGVYARLRGARPDSSRHSADWDRLHAAELKIHGQSKFSPNIYADWVEIYVCDLGVGITHDIEDWERNSFDIEVKTLLKKVKSKPNKLHSLTSLLFSKPLSKDPRHDSTKTTVTGLKDLGHLLQEGHDYCRLYENGAWVGNHHPWGINPEGAPTCTQKNIHLAPLSNRYRNILDLSEPINGTAYAFSIQPHNYKPSDNLLLAKPDLDTLDSISDALRYCDRHNPKLRVDWYDHRTDSSCEPPVKDCYPELDVLVLRPPRLISKEDVSRWIRLIAGIGNARQIWKVSSFVIAELSPYQALWFCALLMEMDVNIYSETNIIIASEEWSTACFTTIKDSSDLIYCSKNNEVFLSGINDSFNIVQLALLLREIDSDIFWAEDIDQCIFSGNIKWPDGSNSSNKKLDKYLDFPHALTFTSKYRACRRALKRCLSLFPGLKPIPGDDLVLSLVKDSIIRMFDKAEDASRCVVVDSVAVTTNTAKKYRRRAYDKAVQAIHVFYNPDSNDGGVKKIISALLWVDSDVCREGNITILEDDVWQRIENTPFIAPHGEASVSILRYRRDKNGSLDFNKSWFGRTPKSMYMDFEKLGALKLGHWVQNTRHDLLTVNIGIAFEYSKLKKGDLYKWLCDTTKKMLDGPDDVKRFIVYPSHFAMDQIVSGLHDEQYFKDIIKQKSLIPIRLIGERTVSPLLVPALVKERIKGLLNESGIKKWEVLIFDDGIVSGKHLNELSQSFEDMGAMSISTIAIIDRSGSPVSEASIEKYTKQNERYWKFDVPGLGSKRDCAICQALNISSTYKDRLATKTLQERMMGWENEWKLVDALSDWHTNGVEPIMFDQPVSVTFGIDVQGNSKKEKEKLFINNSVHLASIMAELTRLTTRSDVAIKKAEYVRTKRNLPEAALQVVAVQLIQYLDELTFWEKRERYKYLLDVLSEIRYVNQSTSLAGLCFTLIDRELLPDIWGYITDDLLKNKEIINADLAIVVSMILMKASSYYGLEYDARRAKTDIELKNICYININETREYIRSYLNLFRFPQSHVFSIHSGPFLDALQKFPLKTQPSDIELKDDLDLILTSIRALSNIINGLIGSGYLDMPDTNEMDRITDELSGYYSNVDLSDNNELERIQGIVKELCTLMDGKPYGTKKSILKNVTTQLFVTLEPRKPVENLLRDIVHELISKWESYYYEKAKVIPWLSKRWMKDGKLIYPTILLSSNAFNDGYWKSKSYAIWDEHTVSVIRDAFSNVIYSDKEIQDPSCFTNSGVSADMWWSVDIDNNCLIITTYNSTRDRKVDLTHNYTFAGFERIGGQRKVKSSDGGGILEVSIHIPLDSKYLEGGKNQWT